MIKEINKKVKELKKELKDFFFELDMAIKKYKAENLILIRNTDVQKIYIMLDDGNNNFFEQN